jgi:hypothetical protein
MSVVNKPLINGKGYSWNSIRLNILGRTIVGVTAIEYDDPETKENIYGAGKHPVERGEGNVEPEASITLLRSEGFAIEEAAKQAGITRIQDIPMFDITVAFLNGTKQVTHVLRGCEFTNNPFSGKQGDTKLEGKYDLCVGGIDR